MTTMEAKRVAGGIANWAVSERTRIAAAMSTGAQWEIWLQVELALYLRTVSGLVLREQRYDGSKKSVDIWSVEGTRAYAFELKTESTMTGLVSGVTMLKAIKGDQLKLTENPLATKVRNSGCTALSAFAIGIGSISKFRATAHALLDANTMAVAVDGDFGLFIVTMEL